MHEEASPKVERGERQGFEGRPEGNLGQSPRTRPPPGEAVASTGRSALGPPSTGADNAEPEPELSERRPSLERWGRDDYREAIARAMTSLGALTPV